MEMICDHARLFERQAGQGEVLVSKLCEGRSLKGALVDITSGGARILLDQPLDSGEVIRLTFLRRPDEVQHAGQMIIGQVLQSRGGPGRYVVGIAFGWYTGVKKAPRPIRRKGGLWSWFGLFSKKRKGDDRPSRRWVKETTKAATSRPCPSSAI
jgi:hypothetical protein